MVEAALRDFTIGTGWRERLDEGPQESRQPAQEEAEIVAGGGEHGVDAVAVARFEVIAVHAVLGVKWPVTSAAHEGLKAATAKVLNSSWRDE